MSTNKNVLISQSAVSFILLLTMTNFGFANGQQELPETPPKLPDVFLPDHFHIWQPPEGGIKPGQIYNLTNGELIADSPAGINPAPQSYAGQHITENVNTDGSITAGAIGDKISTALSAAGVKSLEEELGPDAKALRVALSDLANSSAYSNMPKSKAINYLQDLVKAIDPNSGYYVVSGVITCSDITLHLISDNPQKFKAGATGLFEAFGLQADASHSSHYEATLETKNDPNNPYVVGYQHASGNDLPFTVQSLQKIIDEFNRPDVSLTLSALQPQFDWVQILNTSMTATGPDANCTHHCHGYAGKPASFYSPTYPGGNVKVLGAQRISWAGNLRWVNGASGLDIIQDVVVVDNGTRALARYQARTIPNTYKFDYHVEQYEQVGTFQVGPIAASFDFGGSYTFKIPNNCTGVVINGTTRDGTIFSINPGSSTIPQNLAVKIVSDSISGPDRLILVSSISATSLLSTTPGPKLE